MWLAYWSCARFNLRLTDEEFYSLTPRQFDALLKRHREKIEHTELLAGVIASAIANFSLGGLKEPAKPADFMPSRWETKAKATNPKKDRMTAKKRELVARNVRAMLTTYVEAQKAAGIK
jgi:hypothetical protein